MRLAAALLVLAVLLAADRGGSLSVGGGSGGPSPELGSFAGYSWLGDVTQISATWTVPSVPSSPDGYAATWIGLQGPAKSEFYQIGTTEQSFQGQVWYEAFWSDEPHQFLAQNVMSVSAGDEIEAFVVFVSGKWIAKITDVTTGRQATGSTSDMKDFRDLNQGEWLQEDPGLPKHRAPYAKAGPVRFWHLEINGTAPSAANLEPEWMNLPHHQDVIPSPFAGDSFSARLTR